MNNPNSVPARELASAFVGRYQHTKTSGHVYRTGPHMVYILHDTCIAWHDFVTETTSFKTDGWYTNFTKCRLESILLASEGNWHIYQVAGEWVMWSQDHGQEVPFYDGITLNELLLIDETIRLERSERKQQRAV